MGAVMIEIAQENNAPAVGEHVDLSYCYYWI